VGGLIRWVIIPILTYTAYVPVLAGNFPVAPTPATFPYQGGRNSNFYGKNFNRPIEFIKDSHISKRVKAEELGM